MLTRAAPRSRQVSEPVRAGAGARKRPSAQKLELEFGSNSNSLAPKNELPLAALGQCRAHPLADVSGRKLSALGAALLARARQKYTVVKGA